MMNKRCCRIWIALLSICLVMPPLLPGTVEAAPVSQTLDILKVEASLSPEGLIVPGQVDLTLVLTNTSKEHDIEQISFSGLFTEDYGTIPAGKTNNFTRSIPIRQEELGKNLQLQIHWNSVNGSFILPVSIPVAKLDAKPSLTLERVVDQPVVMKGQQVNFTYTITNTGNVPVTNIILSDTPFDATIKEYASLAPDEKTPPIVKPFTVDAETISNPKLEFTYNGQLYTASCPPITIQLQSAIIELELTADKTIVKPGDSVRLNCIITNKGTTTIEKIKVTDPTLGILKDDLTLAPNEPYSIEGLNVVIDEKKSFLFSLTAVQSGTNAPIEAKSAELTINLLSSASDIKVAIEAKSDVLNLAQSGNVNFELKLYNQGTATLYNLIITEETLGIIDTVDQLNAEQAPHIVIKSFHVEKNQAFFFTVTASDDQGNTKSSNTDPLFITVGLAPSASPAASASPIISDIPIAIDEQIISIIRSILTVLVVIAALMGTGAGIIFLYLKNTKPKQKKPLRPTR